MVVDDSSMIRSQIQQIVSGTSYEVATCCHSGEEALDRYDRVSPDVVTLDITMPGMSGLDTARTLLQDHNDAKIIIVSSLRHTAPQEAQKIGVLEFVEKPIDRVQLLAALERTTG